jgi:4,5-DOPA dioxygenase extradiol
MNRKHFLQLMSSIPMISTLSSFQRFIDELVEQDELMPVLFVGHGSPMNAIEDNEFSQRWQQMAKEIPTPKAVLVVSAHWLTQGTRITAMDFPKTIHDFGGFPQSLFDVQYKAPGNGLLAQETATLLSSKAEIALDHDWGLDHGAWSVVKQMYPKADIPVLQLSIDYYKGAAYMYDLAKALIPLRKKGILILASGNMVHNLGMLNLQHGFTNAFGYDWTHEINSIMKEKISNGDHQALVNYNTLHKDIKYAIPTPDHYFPLIYALALQQKNDKIAFFNDKAVAGSLTMTSIKIG